MFVRKFMEMPASLQQSNFCHHLPLLLTMTHWLWEGIYGCTTDTQSGSSLFALPMHPSRRAAPRNTALPSQ